MRHLRSTLFWLFLFVFLLTLCVTAPSTLVATLLEQLSGGRLTLAQTQGTLWKGSGVLLLQHDSKFLPLGRYAWKLYPSADLRHINVDVDSGGAQETQIHISPWKNTIDVQHAYANLPAQLLAVFAPPLSPYRLSGELLLTTESFNISPQSVVGNLNLDWKQATSGLTDIAPLGDYRIVMQGKGSALDIKLSTQQGKLKLDGSGQMQPGSALTFNGTAQAAPEQKEALSELLHHIGPELSPGVFSFALVSQ